ncbi:hypothetical protein [Streptomyces sp. NPDC059861]|uniref:hypothetical protein n=1 Tax=Streptomyces sp. NPDC059861 TaxID=3346974 RepID=UPI00364A75AC
MALRLRGQLTGVVREVEAAVPAAPEDAKVRIAAHAGLREARRLLAVTSSALGPWPESPTCGSWPGRWRNSAATTRP